MAEGAHFRPVIDSTLDPKEHGRIAAGRGVPIDECPYDDPVNILRWQEGWRAKIASLRRLHPPGD